MLNIIMARRGIYDTFVSWSPMDACPFAYRNTDITTVHYHKINMFLCHKIFIISYIDKAKSYAEHISVDKFPESP